jgi:hypothetical protein
MPNKFYHKYQDALEAKGYRVDEHGYVWDDVVTKLQVKTTTVTYRVKTLT